MDKNRQNSRLSKAPDDGEISSPLRGKKRGSSKASKKNRQMELEILLVNMRRDQEMLQRHCNSLEAENEALRERNVILEEENVVVRGRESELVERARAAERVLDAHMKNLGKRDEQTRSIATKEFQKVNKALEALRTEAEDVVEAHGFQDILHGRISQPPGPSFVDMLRGQDVHIPDGGRPSKMPQRHVYSVTAARPKSR